MNMNLINATSFSQNLSLFSNWVDSTPVHQVIDTVTYDVYESNNPFRYKFSDDKIKNDLLRKTANATTTVGAEVFSAFMNPYYLTHKIVKLPSMYQGVVNTYKKYSISGNKEA